MLGDNEHGLECLQRLNGKIHIICGNHCTNVRRSLYRECCNVVEVVEAKKLKWNGYNFFLTHYPCLISRDDVDKPLKNRTISLCGHCHTKDKWLDFDKGLIYHCELDASNNAPILIDNIIIDIKNKLGEN